MNDISIQLAVLCEKYTDRRTDGQTDRLNEQGAQPVSTAA